MSTLKHVYFMWSLFTASPVKHLMQTKVNVVSATRLLGQSHDFWRAYSLFVARVASFAPERIIININTPKPNRTNLIHIERLFNKKSRSGLQIPFTASTLPFSQRKGAF